MDKILSIFCDESGDVGPYKDLLPNERKTLFTKLYYFMSMCFDNHETRKINPNNYKLFQVADLVCTLELINKKIQTNNLTKSEQYIFHSKSDFKKDFYKKYSRNIMS